MPRPPLGRGGGSASALTERLSPAAAHGQALSSYNLSVSLRSTAPLVGEPLAKPFTLRGLPKPLPLGEVAPKVTERASPAGKSRGRSDRQALCQSDAIAVSELFGSGLALSVGLAPASSPKGGALGMSVSFRLDAESPTGRKRAGLATEGSGFWTTFLVKLSLA